MSSYTVGDAISELNVMIQEAPISNEIACKLADIVLTLEVVDYQRVGEIEDA